MKKLIFVMLFVISNAAIAVNTAKEIVEDNKVLQDMNNMSHELSECSAYYLIVAQAMDNHTPNAGDGYRQRGVVSLDLAILLLNQRTVMSRFQLATTDMLGEIEHNFSNTARLKIKHHKTCFTDLDTRMQYWLDN